MNKRGLGKGLGALIDVSAEEAVSQGALLEIDVNLIDANKAQPRKTFDQEKLEELAESIKQHGIIQPLVLKKNGARYIIVAGERRYRAARMAGLSKVPAVLKDVGERELLQISIVENIQREDLNPIEEAQAISVLMDKFSLNQEEAANILGRSRSAVANSLRLLALPEEVAKMVSAGSLSSGHARALLAVKDKKLMVYAAGHVADHSLSVRETEEYAKKLASSSGEKQKKLPVQKTPEFTEAERTLSETLETKVQLMGNDRRGKIVIEYFSKDQLFSLYELFQNIRR